MVGLIPTRIGDLDQGPINESNTPRQLFICTQDNPSFDAGHQISFANGWLMFDAMNNASSQFVFGTNST
jgi:hypothetical protein